MKNTDMVLGSPYLLGIVYIKLLEGEDSHGSVHLLLDCILFCSLQRSRLLGLSNTFFSRPPLFVILVMLTTSSTRYLTVGESSSNLTQQLAVNSLNFHSIVLRTPISIKNKIICRSSRLLHFFKNLLVVVNQKFRFSSFILFTVVNIHDDDSAIRLSVQIHSLNGIGYLFGFGWS